MVRGGIVTRVRLIGPWRNQLLVNEMHFVLLMPQYLVVRIWTVQLLQGFSAQAYHLNARRRHAAIKALSEHLAAPCPALSRRPQRVFV